MTLSGSGGSREPEPRSGRGEGLGEEVVVEFAKELRALRASAASPAFRSMAKATHYSHSALAEATSGRRLPTEAVVRAFASACGADADIWAAKLAAAQAGAATAASIGDEAETETAAEPVRRPRLRALTLRSAVVVGLAAVGAAAGALWAESASGGSASGSTAVQSMAALPTVLPSVAASAQAMDGSDPVAAGCVKDAVLVDKLPVMQNATQVGALEIKYSRKCSAAWARAYLYDGQARGFADVSLRMGDGRSVSFADLVTTVPVYTNVLSVQPNGCVQAAVGVLLGTGSTVTAQTPCEAP